MVICEGAVPLERSAGMRCVRRLPIILVFAALEFTAAHSRAAEAQAGTVHVPAFDLPRSGFLSAETLAELKRQAEAGQSFATACPLKKRWTEIASKEEVMIFRECLQRDTAALIGRHRARYKVKILPETFGGVAIDVVTPIEGVAVKNQQRVLINLHGGAFMWGGRGSGRAGLVESIPIAAVGKFKIVSVDYRMAPEHRFPAASEDIAKVYRALLAQYEPENIGIFGCSAGGFLTAQAVAWLLKEGLPTPGAVGMFCAGALPSGGGDSEHLWANILGDRSSTSAAAPKAFAYLNAEDRKDPLAFPGLDPLVLARFPDSLLITSTRDFLMSSAVVTHAQLVKLGVKADLHVFEGLGHGFLYEPELPESRQAYEVIAHFFNEHLVARNMVETTSGPVRGKINPTTITYLGIPYAEPPVGELRWQPPRPSVRWQPVRDATKFGQHCFQATANSAQANASEDCLFLNMYVPSTRRLSRARGYPRKPRPVMVWIHGGANATGASDFYDPTPLVETGDVVVVTLNYRLGPFGFLAHPALDAEGHAAVNYGILDQQLALKWVRANIGRFGGDAGNVTIFGESAGGLNVATHLASPLSAGLFDRAIIQSGAYELDTPSLAASEGLGIAFAKGAGCTEQTAACLRALPVATVLANAGELGKPTAGYNQSTVDGRIVVETQRSALKAGRFNRVPVMQGNNSDEGRVSGSRTLSSDDYRNKLQSLASAAGKDPAAVLKNYSLERYSSAYEALSAAQGDRYFACSARQSSRLLAQWVPTYAYEFRDAGATSLGAAHGAELKYLFNIRGEVASIFDGGPEGLSPSSQRLSAAMRSSWASFADSGVPEAAATTRWLPGSERVQLFEPDRLGSEASPEFGERHRCTLWD